MSVREAFARALGLSPDASRQDVERHFGRLLDEAQDTDLRKLARALGLPPGSTRQPVERDFRQLLAEDKDTHIDGPASRPSGGDLVKAQKKFREQHDALAAQVKALGDQVARRELELAEAEEAQDPRERLAMLAELRQKQKSVTFIEALEQVKGEHPDLVRRAGALYGPKDPLAPRALFERGGDPREQLVELAEARVREKGLPFPEALEQVKQEHLELVEAVAAHYR